MLFMINPVFIKDNYSIKFYVDYIKKQVSIGNFFEMSFQSFYMYILYGFESICMGGFTFFSV